MEHDRVSLRMQISEYRLIFLSPQASDHLTITFDRSHTICSQCVASESLSSSKPLRLRTFCYDHCPASSSSGTFSRLAIGILDNDSSISLHIRTAVPAWTLWHFD